MSRCSRSGGARAYGPIYFHLVDGTDVFHDPEGKELTDFDAVVNAHYAKRSLISSDARMGHVRLDQSIVIENGEGETVRRLPFPDALTIVWPAAHPGRTR